MNNKIEKIGDRLVRVTTEVDLQKEWPEGTENLSGILKLAAKQLTDASDPFIVDELEIQKQIDELEDKKQSVADLKPIVVGFTLK